MIDDQGSQPNVRIEKVRGEESSSVHEVVAVEEPLEIRLAWQANGRIAHRSLAVTMRTPGDDFELAAGFAFAEGIVRSRDDIVDISRCGETGDGIVDNIVMITLRPGLTFDASRLDRNFYTTSSCGVCGKATLEALEIRGCAPLASRFSVSREVIGELPQALHRSQELFHASGGLHAAGLFDRDGSLLALREDVGRHNALDKVIGRELLGGRLPLEETLLLVSGRASFEIMQKALAARIPIVAAISAPSSLAVELAQAFDMTLVGFVRDGGFNVYAGPGRLSRGRRAADVSL